MILNKFTRTKNREQNLLNKIAEAQFNRYVRKGIDGYLTPEQVTRKRR
jgi:hypothetical protein